jgi:hypothetical protein
MLSLFVLSTIKITPKSSFGLILVVAQVMSAKKRLARHVPILVALLYLATGDYLSLLRQIRLLF